MPRRQSPGLPSRKQILDFIASSDVPAGKREIARAFGLGGQDKIDLKRLLKDMADEGLIDSSPGRAFHQTGGVPKVTVLRVQSVDDSGTIWAVPEQWHAETPPPRLRVIERGRRGALGIGDRILSRTEEKGQGLVAHPMKKLERSAELVMGVARKDGDRFWLSPVDKRERREFPIAEMKDAEAGDLVLCEVSGRPPRLSVRVDAVLGDPFAPRSFSLIAIHKHGLRHEFAQEAIDEAHRVARTQLGEREDLSHLPIVAIDPADARDHDDAIWAAARDDGGWDAIVAIADVSFYVRPGSELDREARARGNSVYFPDRVVPMLPEELSADICSLKAGADRAALACHLTVAKDGTVTGWRFTRAKIRVAANIAYEDAQAAIDGVETFAVTPDLVETALKPLWACWRSLFAARQRRDPLELDLPERRVVLDEKGRIMSIAARERLDAHKLVEDFMIAANVAAARALEAKK
ncbi:MAG: RNB domain-containing ribonuclease, partial [Sphingomicrobium sp.]